jgi:hypothetical protein
VCPADVHPDLLLTAIERAESLRINPTATRTQLDRMKRIVESWPNLP